MLAQEMLADEQHVASVPALSTLHFHSDKADTKLLDTFFTRTHSTKFSQPDGK